MDKQEKKRLRRESEEKLRETQSSVCDSGFGGSWGEPDYEGLIEEEIKEFEENLQKHYEELADEYMEVQE